MPGTTSRLAIFKPPLLGPNYQKRHSSALALFVLKGLLMHNGAKRILIADGDNTFRESLSRFMRGLGHEVFEASTGTEAVERASTLHPDLIMIDLRLPGMTGDEATKRLKTNVGTRHIPVIINAAWTTACNVEERAERALLAGAAEILYKPFQMPMLRDVLRSYLFA